MSNDGTFDTEALRAKDRAHLFHAWQNLGDAQSRNTTIIAQSDGVYVTDSSGHRMLDGMGGMWCVNVGHGRAEIAQAIADQATRMCYFSPFNLANPPAIELATRLAAYAPGDLRHVFFTTGGSTAVESALRFVQFYFHASGRPAKRHIITRENAYHGSTHLTASISGKPGDRGGFDLITDTVHHLRAPHFYHAPSGMSEAAFLDSLIEELEAKILAIGPNNVACFVAEPVMGSGGVIVPPVGYQLRTYEVCQRYEVLYISDETVTGFGRLGEIFASERLFGISPDIVTCAKGLTSGYVPLGAMLVSARLYEAVTGVGATGQFFANGFTYSGHPVACAAGIATLDILEREEICAHVREIGPYFQARMQELVDLPIVGEVRGTGLMLALEFVSDRAKRTPPPNEWTIARRVSRYAMSRGLMVRPAGGHLIVLSPPLIVGREHVDQMTEIVRRSILDAMDELTSEGLAHGAAVQRRT